MLMTFVVNEETGQVWHAAQKIAEPHRFDYRNAVLRAGTAVENQIFGESK